MGEKVFIIPRGLSDLMKVMAATLVALAHYFNIKASAGNALNPLEWLIRSQGGNVGVAIFFFLSGYGLMMSEMRTHLAFKRYLKRRFAKVYLPVLLITACWLPIYYSIYANDTFEKTQLIININCVICDLFLNFRDPVLWFIKSLLILYAAFYLFAYILQNGRQKFAFAVLWIITILTCIISYFSNGSFGLNSISGIPLFSVGVIAASHSAKFYKNINAAFIPLVISFILLSCVFALHSRFVANIVHVLADYSIIGTILLCFSNTHPDIKIPSILAAVTFDIYLIHFKILMLMSVSNLELSIIPFIVATVFVSIIFYQLRTQILKFQ